MNNDQVKGRIETVEGKVKQVAGEIIGDKAMEKAGALQKNAGTIQTVLGDFKEDLKDNLNKALKTEFNRSK